jgi:ribose transport system substrate-binding protein
MINRLSANDAGTGITNIPQSIDAGLLRITKENADQILKNNTGST